MLYNDIIKRFKSIFKNGYKIGMIDDVRPCKKPYSDIEIPEAIIIWLSNKDKIIYIPYQEEKHAPTMYSTMIYYIIKSKMKNKNINVISENYIIELVGIMGLTALKKDKLIERWVDHNTFTVGASTTRLYTLCNDVEF